MSMRRGLNNRSTIHMSSTNNIINNRQNDSPKSPNNTEIHRLHTNRRLGGPHTKETRNQAVNYSEAIDKHTPNTRDMERAPDEFCADGIDRLIGGYF